MAISATARTWRDSVEAVASRLRQKVVLQTHRATVMEPQTMAGALVAGVRPLLLHEQRARATVFRIRARRETVPLPSATLLSNPFTSKPIIMRSYPHNSPEAAARIVAMVLIADGQVCMSEFDILKKLGAERELGLVPQLLPHLVYTLREELMLGGYATGSLLDNVDDSTLASLMAEVSDPVLRRTVLRLSLAAARADGHLADGEARVVEAARHHWQLFDGEEPVVAPRARRQATRPEPPGRFGCALHTPP
ncbi:hypothetical protein [Methyloversatilis sp.]|uniref:hypothetical protein n=1 Tax=Methyloversatilis sp. TaxID=2569862 RepID=UPI003F6E9ACE